MAAVHSFKDHVGVIEELKAKYQRSDDDSRALAVERLQDDIATMAQAREQQVRDAIRGLSLDVAAAKAAATPPEPESAHAERAEGLLAATLAAEEELAELSQQDSTYLRKQRLCLEAQTTGCQQRSERVEDLVTDAEPHTRYELSLYAHISHITWQLERSTSHVRGTVSDMVGKDIKFINLNPGEMSEFELVNAVWDILG